MIEIIMGVFALTGFICAMYLLVFACGDPVKEVKKSQREEWESKLEVEEARKSIKLHR